MQRRILSSSFCFRFTVSFLYSVPTQNSIDRRQPRERCTRTTTHDHHSYESALKALVCCGGLYQVSNTYAANTRACYKLTITVVTLTAFFFRLWVLYNCTGGLPGRKSDAWQSFHDFSHTTIVRFPQSHAVRALVSVSFFASFHSRFLFRFVLLFYNFVSVPSQFRFSFPK